ncbi:hypothetical protein Bpfe_004546, partial [Biomphalaria pfeifferi]
VRQKKWRLSPPVTVRDVHGRREEMEIITTCNRTRRTAEEKKWRLSPPVTVRDVRQERRNGDYHHL